MSSYEECDKISGKVKHSLFILEELRKMKESFLDVTIICFDGSLRKNKLLVSLMFPYLNDCQEFSSPDLDAFIILPDFTTEELELQMDTNIFGEVPQLVLLEQKSWGTIENITESMKDEEIQNSLKAEIGCDDTEDKKSLIMHLKNKANLIDSSSDLIGDNTIGVSEEINLLNIFGDQHQFSAVDNCFGIGIPIEDVSPSKGTDNHQKGPSTKEMFPCDICGKQFNKYQILIHSKTHEKPICCAYCDKRFARLKSCKMHEVNIHGDLLETIVEVHENGAVKKSKPDGNLHPCVDCGKTFAALSHLESHRRTHTKEKPFQCSMCPKGFTVKGNLVAHERIHAGTHKRFPCPECEKKFSHPSEVKNHMVVHTDLRTHVCHNCGTSYRRYSNLWRHSKKCPKINATIDGKAKGRVILVAPLAVDVHKPQKKRTYNRRKPKSDNISVIRDPLEVENKAKHDDISDNEYQVVDVNNCLTIADCSTSQLITSTQNEECNVTVEEGEVLIEEMELIEEIKVFP